MWFQIDGDRKHMCDQCGQFFKLYHIETEDQFLALSEEEKTSIYLRYRGKLDLPDEEQEAGGANVLAAFHVHPDPAEMAPELAHGSKH